MFDYTKYIGILMEDTAVRNDLKRGARVARSMGFKVNASHFNDRISSYYVYMPRTNDPYRPMKIRISDHDIPQTQTRAQNDQYQYGADIYASDSSIRNNEWWRKAFETIQNGGQVDGDEFIPVDDLIGFAQDAFDEWYQKEYGKSNSNK